MSAPTGEHGQESTPTQSHNHAPRESSPTKSRYIPALDGLRALAVLAVIAYHMGMSWAPGGLLGVTVFFVLSGYLITSLLLIEWDNTKRINLPQFWLRRVRRLLPAIIFIIVCSAALCTIFDHSLLTKLREDMWAALLWVTNWWYIFHDVSYFDALGSPSPLTHFWSLAIEEQFYLIWPVVLLIAHKFGAKRTTMRNATLVFALASALEMALLFNPDADPSRVYYGTDTRAFSLLIGAWLAFVWPSHLLGAKSGVHLTKRERNVLDGVGIAALVALLALIVLVDGFSPFLYRGGLLLASVLTAVIIAVMVHPASLLGRIAGAKPLVWIGLRSYGIYLWHYPLLLLMNPRNFTGETPWWMYLVQIAIIFACAAFSYHFVEDPLRHGALGKFAGQIRAKKVSLPAWARDHVIPLAAGTTLTLVAVGGLIFVPPTSALEGGDLLKQEEAHVVGIPENKPNSGPEDNPENDTAAEQQPRLDVLMIGDSVSVRAIPYFQETFPYGAIDAAVNRQLPTGSEVYATYAQQDIVGNVVVFALGTNGAASDEQIDELMAAVGPDKQTFFINTRSPQPWVDDTNGALASAPERYQNAHVIDWYGASAGHDEYFDGDGTHLTEEGAQAYINLIYEAISSLLPAHEEGDTAAQLKTPLEAAAAKAQAATSDAVRALATVATESATDKR